MFCCEVIFPLANTELLRSPGKTEPSATEHMPGGSGWHAHPLSRNVLSYLPKTYCPHWHSGTLPNLRFSPYIFLIRSDDVSENLCGARAFLTTLRNGSLPLTGPKSLQHSASRPDATMARTRFEGPAVEQLDHARMLPGVGGCETPRLSTPLSKKIGKSVVGELTAAVRPEATDVGHAQCADSEFRPKQRLSYGHGAAKDLY